MRENEGMEQKPREQPSWGRIAWAFFLAMAWLFVEAWGPLLMLGATIILFLRCA